MRVLMLSRAFDIGGQGHRIVEAFKRHSPDWLVRSMVRLQNSIGYPEDLPYRLPALQEQYQAADVIHTRNDFVFYDQMAAKYGPKPVVYHGHGTKLRSDPNTWIREIARHDAIALVSTLDLYLISPETFEWLPAPINVDAMQELRRQARP